MQTYRVAVIPGDGIGTRSGSGGDQRAGGGSGALSVRVRVAGISLGLRVLRRARPHDAGRRARPAAAVRRHLLRRGRRSAAPGQRHAQRPAAADSTRLRSVRVRAAGRALSGRARARSPGRRRATSTSSSSARTPKGEYAQVGGVVHAGGPHEVAVQSGDVHAPRHRARHPLRVRSRPAAESPASPDVGDQVERAGLQHGVLGSRVRRRRARLPGHPHRVAAGRRGLHGPGPAARELRRDRRRRTCSATS